MIEFSKLIYTFWGFAQRAGVGAGRVEVRLGSHRVVVLVLRKLELGVSGPEG